jgi:amidase
MAGLPIAAPGPGPFRVAVHEEDGLQPVASACRAAVRRAADALAAHGHELVDAAPPAAAEVRAAYDTMLMTEAAQLGPWEAAERSDELSRYGRGFMEMARSVQPDLGRYLEAAKRPYELETEADAWLERHPLVLCPVTIVSAPRAADGITTVDGEPARPGGKMTLCTWASAFGLPAASVPAGRDDAGLPLAVQVTGRRGHDLEVLAVAQAFEEALGGWVDPRETPGGPLLRSR